MFHPGSLKKKCISAKSRYTETAPNGAMWKPRKDPGRRQSLGAMCQATEKLVLIKILKGGKKITTTEGQINCNASEFEVGK